jgi:hypothetical protein
MGSAEEDIFITSSYQVCRQPSDVGLGLGFGGRRQGEGLEKKLSESFGRKPGQKSGKKKSATPKPASFQKKAKPGRGSVSPARKKAVPVKNSDRAVIGGPKFGRKAITKKDFQGQGQKLPLKGVREMPIAKFGQKGNSFQRIEAGRFCSGSVDVPKMGRKTQSSLSSHHKIDGQTKPVIDGRKQSRGSNHGLATQTPKFEIFTVPKRSLRNLLA